MSVVIIFGIKQSEFRSLDKIYSLLSSMALLPNVDTDAMRPISDTQIAGNLWIQLVRRAQQ